MEKYNFVGKNIDQHTEGVSEYLENKKNSSMGLTDEFPKELDKKQSEIEDINKISSAINSELKELDLPPNFTIDPKQIHFLPTKDLGGAYYQNNQQITISRSKNLLTIANTAIYQTLVTLSNINVNKKLLQFETILHESIHHASYNKHLIKETPETIFVDPYRLGYDFGANDELNYFRGLNEAVVQKTTQDIIFKMSKSNGIQRNVHKTLFSLNHSYASEIAILEKIMSKISKSKNEDQKEVWKRFKKGQFTGEMMHLRDVEKVYGPGSLRILASMNTRKTNPLKKVLYYTYFSTNKKSLRESIARILLRKDKITKEKYDKHINNMEDK